MRIMFLDSPSFGKEDMKDAFISLGYTIDLFYDERVYDRKNQSFDLLLENKLSQAEYDFVFSFNYFPALSNGCQKKNIKYISLVYDSPLSSLYSTTVLNECNYIFVFDRVQVEELNGGGINTVYYMPLCANVERLDQIDVPMESQKIVSSDVSFVGSLYDEKHNLFDRMEGALDEETKGYLYGIMEAQLQVQGYSFVQNMLTPDLVAKLQKCAPYQTQVDGVETDAYIYAQYFLARKMTSMERQRLLKMVSEKYSLKLYTHNQPKDMPKANYIGAIDWDESMPAVFKHSKINLNITLRSIQSGIPLRAFDIMGARGFLLTNYQADLFDLFVPGEDFVYYESPEDLIYKIGYYLKHEEERIEIAKNGYEKIKKFHTYLDRAKQMVSIINSEA